MVLKLKEHGANPLLTSKGCLVRMEKMVRTDRMDKMVSLVVMAKMGLMGSLHV